MISQFYTLKRLLGRYAKEHLFIPLIVGLIILVAFDQFIDIVYGREHPIHEEVTETIGHLLIVLVTFFVTLYEILTEEDIYKFRFDDATSRQLDHYLEGAQSYFAVSVINLKYWFEPSAQRYFRQLANHQGITFERALLFFDNNEIEDLKKEDLEQHAARLFAETHYEHKIKLSYLSISDIFELVDAELLEKMGCSKRVASRYRRTQKKKGDKFRHRIRELDFAVVTYKDGSSRVLFTKTPDKKRPGRAILEKAGDEAKPYLKFVKDITTRVHGDNGRLNPEYDFIGAFAPNVGMVSHNKWRRRRDDASD